MTNEWTRYTPARGGEAPREAADWACERCCDRAFPKSTCSREHKIRFVRGSTGLHNIARFIEATEQPPIDPLLLIQAREIAARVCEGWRTNPQSPCEAAAAYREGARDDGNEVAFIAAQLRINADGEG